MLKRITTGVIVALSLVTSVTFASNPHYAMVVDAGSTGSRLYLFSYQTDKSVPVINELFVASTQPGLSSYEKQPEQAAESLKPLLDGAEQKLKSLGQSSTSVSISVLGTGGMRLLPEETQAAIYASIKQYITLHYSTFTPNQVGTITGKTEGIYGWLDVNYLMGTLDSRETYGNIDMGGASTQISFEAEAMLDPENEITMHIDGRDRVIYSKSFIGLGLEESRKEMNQSQSSNTCYPYHYQVSAMKVGHFNFRQCELAYEELIDRHHVHEEVTHVPNRPFIAYSGAYRTLDFFGMRDAINQGVMETNLQSTCSHPWEDLKNMYPNIPEKDLSTYCANGVYLDDLFYNGYHLSDTQVYTATQVNKQNINWTLGALLFELLQAS